MSKKKLSFPPPAKGKLLRVKEGYNPNSSSVGSIVFAFPAVLYAVPVLFGSISALILAQKLKVQSAEDSDEKPEVGDNT